jgi:hypothetical protein
MTPRLYAWLPLATVTAALAGPIPSTMQDDGRLPNEVGWAAPSRETRPWTRWWWLGNAVDETNLTRILTEFQDAGLGGVEICPIYGVKGCEDRFVDFLSPRWVYLFAHTMRQAIRLDLGVDLTAGTGWPFGGPRVTAQDASARVDLEKYNLAAGASLTAALPKGQLQCLLAISDTGERLDLTGKVKDGELNWTASRGRWRLYALAAESPVQKVKRAAPGGEGAVLNPYSAGALDQYLSGFTRAFTAYQGGKPRALFHDSFEYYNADWAPNFFRQFKERRGYDLRAQLPALAGEGDPDAVARVKHDYRETLSDLHIAWIERWTRWAHRRGSLTRNQAHGAPANLVDVYAAADIPETEIFGGLVDQNILMNKFASSAAHLSGRRLSSAESFTWLTEHFQATLGQVKSAADCLFLSGANQLFFHGIPYSPAEAPWPGWQFYAALNFGPQGGLWRDLPFFNAYVARCASVLQSGAPANDVLLYFPIHDFWQSQGKLFMPFTVEAANRWLGGHPVHADAEFLWEQGYGYDALSDRFLQQAKVKHGKIFLNGNGYRVILVPETKYMPETTLQKLIALAGHGATILFENQLPSDVPGLGNLTKRRGKFQKQIARLRFESGAVRRARIGQGAFLVGTNLATLLPAAGVVREPGVDLGLRFVRRTQAEGWHYFIVNRGDKTVEGWVTLGTRARSALILDPRFDSRIGLAALKSDGGATRVYLQLQPGESLILRTFTDKTVAAAPWTCFQGAGEPQTISGSWKVRFIEGGPELPAGFETEELASWTTRDDARLKRFAGTARYTIEFEKPAAGADDWLLDLGRVCDSARVRLNGEEAGALWCPPFEIAVGKFLKPGKNLLEIEVTNLAANRIRDLDERKVNWKYFYDINVVSRNYKLLDASTWPLRDSGLLGPVVLKPVRFVAAGQ